MTRWSSERAELNNSGEAPPGLTQAQLNTYLLQVRLEEINKKLTYGDLRPSQYMHSIPDSLKRQLEDERARIVEEALNTNPEFMTPIDYLNHIKDNREKSAASADTSALLANPSTISMLNEGGIKKIGAKWAEKIWIPQREFPDVNFIGLLIGPRGNTLKKMEAESGAKISIRGKGSLKDGKNDPASLAAAEEELHALITGDSSERVARASRLINDVIDTASSTPEAANELKRQQLRELASLNGTLRDAEDIICANCGQAGHRRYECTERRSVTATTICRICGGGGHLASDCAYKNDPDMIQASRKRAEQIDHEYEAFMSEVGISKKQTSAIGDAADYGAASSSQYANPNTAEGAEAPPVDPAMLQQYYAQLMQAWDPSAFTQNWNIPPPPPPPQ
jgi:splicing factor 1